jgi:Uma2 family endonuclease
MGLRQPATYISVEDYLAGEKDSPVRHEYVDGYVYAMAGTSKRHNRIAINFTKRLDDHLENSRCEVYMADLKVYVSPTVYYYPDVVVACDPPDGDEYTSQQPILIIEVLSSATAKTDRREKLHNYRRIPGLLEYVMVAQDRVRIEAWRRRAGDEWEIEFLTRLDDALELESVGLSVGVAQVYRNVRLDTAPAPEEPEEIFP